MDHPAFSWVWPPNSIVTTPALAEEPKPLKAVIRMRHPPKDWNAVAICVQVRLLPETVGVLGVAEAWPEYTAIRMSLSEEGEMEAVW